MTFCVILAHCVNEALLNVAGVTAFLLQLFLTANKVSKSEGTSKVGCAYHF